MSSSPEISLIKTPEDRKNFLLAVLADLETFGEMLEDNSFETGISRVGVEQELDFIDQNQRPSALVPRILDYLEEGPFTTEYAKFNLEINSNPHEIAGRVFQNLAAELDGHLEKVKLAAREHFDSRIILTGLLPTIRRHDVRPDALTPNRRYKTMLSLVNEMRGTEYEFRIRGIDELVSRDNPTVFGGTFTSFQIHCQTEPDRLPAHYNWAQMIAGPVLAAATNSPLFLGRRLWRETRIALFAQTTDTRRPQANLLGEEARVSFGQDWVRGGILDLFRDELSRHRAFVTNRPTLDRSKSHDPNDIPTLDALNFHNGTIYRWNRVCYGIGGGKPHLRIENRILPAGPTVTDEMANTALWLGLMLAVPADAEHLPDQVPFQDAHENFLKAARSGLGVAFRWYGETIAAQELIVEKLVPLAMQGLDRHGVDPDESKRLLGIISDRVTSGKTGAQWILDSFDHLRETRSPGEAATYLTSEMFDRAETEQPVHQWSPIPGSPIKPVTCDATWTLEQMMTTNLRTVHPDDPQEFAAKVMTWNGLSHLAVVDNDGQLHGVLSRTTVLEKIVENQQGTVTEALDETTLKMPLDGSLEEGLEAMRDHGTDYIAVMEDGALAGLLTAEDIVRLAPQMLSNTETVFDQ